MKCEFGKARVVFLGHVVGHGQVQPVNVKVEAIVNFPIPQCKRELMRFLGMAGYYRKFCRNFSDVVYPLTNLLGKRVKFQWDSSCQAAFENVKAILMNSPVLQAPNFEKAFKLQIDASDVGAGGVLIQEDESGIDHPVCYFSKSLISIKEIILQLKRKHWLFC